MRLTLLILATLTSGLMAGLFWAFSYAVMPGLRRTGDRTMVDAMRAINVAIVNPLFLTLFFGALLLPAAALLFVDGAQLWWTVGGVAGHLATMVVTVAGNIPLNNALAAAGDGDDPAVVRAGFERRWTLLNHVRCATSLAAFACLALALAA